MNVFQEKKDDTFSKINAQKNINNIRIQICMNQSK
jgi:hypothetical protein